MEQLETQSDPRQFTIGSLFFWTAYLATAMLLYVAPSMLTYLVVPLALILAPIVTGRTSFQVVFIMALGWLIAFCGHQIWAEHQKNQPLSDCQSNTRLIVQALLDYEAAHGSLPPAYTLANDGTPLHSWRTLILPFVEPDSKRFQKIDLNLPWNHPKNLVAASPTPTVYQCPNRTGYRHDDGTTDYIGIVGPGLVWNSSGTGTLLKDVDDSKQSKLLVVELKQHRIPWMSPQDMEYGQLLRLVESSQGAVFDSHYRFCNCGTCDGNVLFLNELTSRQELISKLKIQDESPAVN